MSSACFVFGDVHGDAVRLRTILQMVKRRVNKAGVTDLRIYSVGDLVDRGPSSKEVVQICIDENVMGVLGNHELWLRTQADVGLFDDIALSSVMGGKATLQSYGIDSRTHSEIERLLRTAIPQAHRDFFKGLPLWRKFTIGDQTYRIIHGGLKKADAEEVQNHILLQLEMRGVLPIEAVDLEDYTLEIVARSKPSVLVWNGPRRGKADEDLHRATDGSIQIFGHIPWPGGAKIGKHWIALDSGCGTCPPYKLSGVFLVEGQPAELLSV